MLLTLRITRSVFLSCGVQQRRKSEPMGSLNHEIKDLHSRVRVNCQCFFAPVRARIALAAPFALRVRPTAGPDLGTAPVAPTGVNER